MIIRRRNALYLLLPLLVLGLGLVGLRYTLTPLLNHLASNQLQKMGLDHIAFDVSEISLNQVVVSGIEIGSDKSLEIPELKASFLWSDLISGRVEEVSFSDVHFRVHVVEGELSFGALDPLFFAGARDGERVEDDDLSLPDWPIKRVNIEAATVEVVSAFGNTTLPFSGVIRQKDDLSVALEEAKLRLVRADTKVDANLNARLTPDGAVEATVSLNESRVEIGDMSAIFGSGSVRMTGNLSDLEGFAAEGTLNVRESRLPFGVEPNADMTITLKDRNVVVSFDVFETRSETDISIRTEAVDVFSENPELALTLDVKSDDISKIASVLALPLPLQGVSEIHLETGLPLQSLIKLSEAADPAEIIKLVPAIRMHFSGQSLASDDVDALGAIEGDISVRTRDGRIEVFSPGEIRANVTGGILRPLIEGVSPYLEGDFSTVELSLVPLVTLSPGKTDQQVDVSLKTDWKVSTGDAHFASGQLAADSIIPLLGNELPEINIRELRLEAKDVALVGGGKANVGLNASSRGEGQEHEGLARLKVSANGLRQEGILVDRVEADMKLAFAVGLHGATVFLTGCDPFRISGVTLELLAEPIRELNGCIRQTGTPAFSVNREGHAGFDLGARLSGKRITLKVEGAPDVMVEPEGIAIRVAGIIKDTGALSVDVSYSGGEVYVPDYNLSVSGLSANAFHNAIDPESPSSDADINVKKIHYETEDELVPPLGLTFHVRQNDDESVFDLGIRDQRGLIRADINGTFDLDAKVIEAALRVPPISLGPKARKVQDYLPMAGEWVKSAEGLGFLAGKAAWDEDEGLRGDLDVLFRGLRAKVKVPGEMAPLKVQAGQLGISVKAAQKNDKITTSAAFLAENVNASMEDLEASGINGLVELDNIWPPRTAGPQTISIAEVLAGLPMYKGAMSVEVNGVENIKIDDISFELAKGKLSVDPIEIVNGNIPSSRIKVEGLQLEELVRLIGVHGLVGRGKLNGAMPVAFREQDIFIEDAVLEAEPGGMIGYLPNGPQEKQSNELKVLEIDFTEMMLGALTNFNYDRLKVNLNGRGRGDMRVRMNLEGRNPDFFTGHPVELEVNVGGRLMEILRTGVNNYEVPENIRQRMLGFGR